MYRAVTLLALNNDIEPDDEEKIYKELENSKIEIDNDAGSEDQYTKVSINGEDVTDEIRSERVGASVSIVSKHSKIRKYLVNLQRKMATKGKAVLEGRDTGSVVCPDADLKVYLTANIQERIRRRKKQLIEKGKGLDDNIIKNEIETRDKIDSSRKDSPLVIPGGAAVIDTSFMTIEEVSAEIKRLFKEKDV